MRNNKLGIIPPHSKSLERSVLGAMLAFSTGLDDAMQLIKDSTVFYCPEHADIFNAIQELYVNAEPVDLNTVAFKLRAAKKEGYDLKLVELVQEVSSSAHVEYHARVLLQYKLRRMIVGFNAQITAQAMDESVDVFELLARWNKEFDNVSELILTGQTTVNFSKALHDLIKRIEMLSKSTGETALTGVHTGFERINKFTGGYQPGDLVILAARPAMGKTAKVLKTVVENAKLGNAVGFISFEMSMEQLTARVVAIDTNFHLGQLLKTGFDKIEYFDSYQRHSGRMEKYPIYVSDNGGSDITDVIVQARTWKRKYDIKLLVVDYLQLIGDKTKGGNRENEVSSISRRLKLLAKELKIPIIALSQLSRAVESRGVKRPMLSDLRESGGIEQDADIVEFIYRPEYYNIEPDDEMMAEGSNTEIIFAKYRGGSVGTICLKWIGDKTKFTDPETFNSNNNYVPAISPAEAFGDDDDSPF